MLEGELARWAEQAVIERKEEEVSLTSESWSSGTPRRAGTYGGKEKKISYELET